MKLYVQLVHFQTICVELNKNHGAQEMKIFQRYVSRFYTVAVEGTRTDLGLEKNVWLRVRIRQRTHRP